MPLLSETMDVCRGVQEPYTNIEEQPTCPAWTAGVI